MIRISALTFDLLRRKLSLEQIFCFS